ncbi:MAG: CHAT domain-containing protein [Chloroflexi bacterium]|nr:CHAT domain-containing protein [Chloroflexota bacterium]
MADIVIRFWRQTYYDDPRVFQAQAIHSPVPIQTGEFRVDIGRQLDDLREALETEIRLSQFFEGSNASTTSIQTNLGLQLFGLLPLSFQASLPRAVQAVATRRNILRLVLEAETGDSAVNLLSLPWELLFHRTPLFAAHSSQLRIVRRIRGAARRSASQLRHPLQLVHVVAEPAEWPIDPQLRATEQDAIRDAVPAGKYTLVTDPGSLERLRTAVEQRQANTIHFLGHGVSRAPNGTEGHLLFAGPNGETQHITGGQLQHVLGSAAGIQLVVLSACGSGSTGGVALDMARSGFPYVVAMQGPITQEAAGVFIPEFYAALQAQGDVASAVAAGRSALATRLSRTLDWCLPILYVNEGIEDETQLSGLVTTVGGWLGQPDILHQLAYGNAMFGAMHLLTGSMLWLSDRHPRLPDSQVMAVLTAIAGAAALLQACLACVKLNVGGSNRPREAPQQPGERIALFLRAWAASAMGVGMGMIYVGMASVLLAGLGTWAEWSILAQGVALSFGLLALLLLGYQQSLGHTQGILNSARVSPLAPDWREGLLIIAGYVLLCMPWAAVQLMAELISPPMGNLLIGGICLALAALLERDPRT